MTVPMSAKASCACTVAVWIRIARFATDAALPAGAVSWTVKSTAVPQRIAVADDAIEASAPDRPAMAGSAGRR
jgi:hypothetical protein